MSVQTDKRLPVSAVSILSGAQIGVTDELPRPNRAIAVARLRHTSLGCT